MYIETAGRGPHVVLLHGTLEPPELLRFLAADLAHDCDVHLVHRTGHGRSGPHDGYTLATDLDALVDYLVDIGADDYTLIGSAEGSYLGLALALDERLPVGSVLAIAPYAGSDSRYASFARDLARRLPGASGSLATELRAFAEAPSLVQRLSGLMTPIELRVGENDDRVSFDSVFRLATSTPHATLEVVPDRGHFLVAEDRAGCIAACRAAVEAERVETPRRGLTGLSRGA